MPYFSERSNRILAGCEARLIKLFELVVGEFDCTIASGYRGKEEQNRLLEEKKSHLGFPHSKHNHEPSHAADVYPYPYNSWDRPEPTRGDRKWAERIEGECVETSGVFDSQRCANLVARITGLYRVYYFAGYVMGIGKMLGYKLRWGGDWNRNHELRDNKFDDLGHFELIEKTDGFQ